MDLYAARQPVFGRDKKILGYELFFKGGLSAAIPALDGNAPIYKLPFDNPFYSGIEKICDGNKIFLNFSTALLIKRAPLIFPADKIIIQLQEGAIKEESLDHVVDACREFALAGYCVAMDYPKTGSFKILTPFARMMIFDFGLIDDDLLIYRDTLSESGIEFVADKINTYNDFNRARAMGFDCFKGGFLKKAEIINARGLSSSKMNLLHIASEINMEDISYDRLALLISWDVSISFKLLRYLNSAYFNRHTDISSIKEAIIFLGESEVKKFILMVIVSEIAADKPGELIKTSISRARFCELICDASNPDGDGPKAFMLGLFSLIDAILDNTMENLMKQIPISSVVKSALINGKGRIYESLKMIIAYESGDWKACLDMAMKLNIDEEKIPSIYIESIGWADLFTGG